MDNLESYLQTERERNKYNPRPDLEEDHDYWKVVLKQAEREGDDTYGVLHGFRCGGAKLIMKDDSLNMEPRFYNNSLWDNQDDYENDKEEWLMPKSFKIKKIFATAAAQIKNRNYFVEYEN